MVHLVRSAYRLEVRVLSVTQNFKALMNEQVVNEEVSGAINCDSQTNPENEVKMVFEPQSQT